MRAQRPCSSETSETGGKSATRCSKFWVRNSENLELRTSNSPPNRPSRESRYSRVRSPSAPIMWAVSFTFKYLPNIIREFCMHGAVGDACALSASGSHVRNLLCTLITCSRYARSMVGSQVHGARSQLNVGLSKVRLSLSFSAYRTQIQ